MSDPTNLKRNIRSSTLANGVRVVTEKMPHVRSAAAGIWICTGARHESAVENGISHFIEHMVFQGTEKRSAEEIARAADSIGGNLDAFTSKELVSFNVKVLDEHLPLAFDLLADIVLHPLFREQDIRKEKDVVLEEIKMELDNPEYVVQELFCSGFWRDHPLGMPILGTPSTVETFDRRMIQEHFREVYTPSNILITAAGNLEHETLFELVAKEFETVPAAGQPRNTPKATPHPHLRLQEKESLKQVHLCLGVPACPVNHESRYAAHVLNTILGGGMSSRLFQNIREKHGLVYSVFSDLSLFQDAGCLLVSAGTSRESVRKVVRLTLDEFKRLKTELVSAEELRRAKDQLKGSLMLSLESTGSRMANLARQQLYFGRFFELDEILAGIESVDQAQLQALAQEYLRPEKLALTILGALDGVRISPAEMEC